MKSTITILVVILTIANAGIAQKYPLQFGGARSIMRVMMEVESQLRTGGPLETVNSVLNGFKNAVGQEQAQHDNVFALQKVECDSEIAYRVQEVSDANVALKVASEIIKVASRLSEKTQATLQATSDILIQVGQHTDLINDVRKEDSQSYNRNAVSFNDAINNIDDSLDLVVNHGSFIQIAGMSSKLLSNAIALRQISAFGPVLQALAQIKQEDDEAELERLGQLLSTLRGVVEAGWTAYGEENSIAAQQFQAQKERFVAQSTRLQAVENRLTNKLEQLQGTLSVQTAAQQANLNKRQRNQTLLDDANNLCNSFDIEYTSTQAGRRAELVLVAELERLVAKRLDEHAD